MKDLKWFQNRIGKRIYRDSFKCCPTCDEIAMNGLIVQDKRHAEYLYCTQLEMKSDGRELNYRDDVV